MLGAVSAFTAFASIFGQVLPPIDPPQPPQNQPRVVVNCSMSGTNFGRQVQVCTARSDEIQLADANPGEPKKSYSDVDGTFIEQYVYRVPKPQTFELNYCANDIIAVRANSLSMTPVVSKRIPAKPGCVDLQIYNFSGLLSVAVRSKTATSNLRFTVEIPPFIPPPPPTMMPPIVPPPLPPMPM